MLLPGNNWEREIYEISEYPSRTFYQPSEPIYCKIEIEGAEETVHVKNTGRCAELLVPGAEVYVQDSQQEAEDWLSDNELYKVKCRWRLVQNLTNIGKNVRRAGT